jgi:hypothetical protein
MLALDLLYTCSDFRPASLSCGRVCGLLPLPLPRGHVSGYLRRHYADEGDVCNCKADSILHRWLSLSLVTQANGKASAGLWNCLWPKRTECKKSGGARLLHSCRTKHIHEQGTGTSCTPSVCLRGDCTSCIEMVVVFLTSGNADLISKTRTSHLAFIAKKMSLALEWLRRATMLGCGWLNLADLADLDNCLAVSSYSRLAR